VRRKYSAVPDVARPPIVRGFRRVLRDATVCAAGILFRDLCAGEAYVEVGSARGDSDGSWSGNLGRRQ
jgi:hypothetical protein